MVYIGERNRQEQIAKAARELPPNPTEEQIKNVSKSYNLPADDVARKRGQLDRPKENYVSDQSKDLYVVEVEGKKYVTPNPKFVPKSAPNTPTTREEFLTSIFTRQGKQVSNRQGTITVREAEGKTTITPKGSVVRSPESAYISPGNVENPFKVGVSRVAQRAQRVDTSGFGPRRIEEPDTRNKYDVFVSNKIKQSTPSPERGLRLQRIGLRAAAESMLLSPIPRNVRSTIGEGAAQFSMGTYEGVRERPVTAGAMAGLGFGLSGATRIAGMAIAAKGIKIAKPLEVAFAVGLPSLYVGTKAVEVSKEEKGFRTRKVGQITGTEIIPMIAGGQVGEKVFPKAIGYARTTGREEVKIEDIADPRILSGKAQFPTAPPKTHLQLFKNPTYRLPGEKEVLGVFHGAPAPFQRTTVTQVGSSELPGLYTAPSLSVHFLKTGAGESSLYSTQLFPSSSPTALYIKPTKVSGISGSRSQLTEFLTTKGTKGEIYVPGIKTEIEGIIPPATRLTRTGRRYYTKYGGVRVPIEEYNVVGGGNLSAGKVAKVVGSSSYGSLRSSVLRPSSFIRVSSRRYSGSSSRRDYSSLLNNYNYYSVVGSSRRGSSISSSLSSPSSYRSIIRSYYSSVGRGASSSLGYRTASSIINRPSSRSITYSSTSIPSRVITPIPLIKFSIGSQRSKRKLQTGGITKYRPSLGPIIGRQKGRITGPLTGIEPRFIR